ncbi:MAG: 23S rRNA (adenine(2030)-N(6))-methyltransferase RlmJ [Xanthobacteraceae bacterium]
MNYQHAFHAGNFADVHKHIVLTLIIEYLRAKPAAFRVIDSHAGAGRYDLSGPEAARSGEWRDGIGRVRSAEATLRQSDAGALFKVYLDVVAALNAGGALRLYPGSPLLAAARLRPQDRLIACELEPRAAASLKAVLRADRGAKVLAMDGWTAIKANVPPKERRGLVVIDPPFEVADDFAKLSGAVAEAHRKWPTGIYMLWYPIKEREAPNALARRLRRVAVPKILRCEVTLAPPRADAGLLGSGLIIVNPPYGLERDLKTLLPVFIRVLAPGAAQLLDWLSREG